MTAQKKRRSNMKCINTVDAVGHVLCHDITRIVKDVTKDTAFRKGHIVTEEDIPVLLSLGKDHLYRMFSVSAYFRTVGIDRHSFFYHVITGCYQMILSFNFYNADSARSNFIDIF